ncbi:alpha-L-fucosidase [Mucilaginibacter rubeus]|uniref:alpha-L-fucosidase n=1 Tax=Mucilaginibacter rubeus TaxID=2027860 RepID=A0A5C1I855_9SPHI|nr:alpha-L-fucosidase [Mucilaginibacter rubeus]QEM14227.1 alpha-L-fucosidase [Mucilaginibacter rubeus]
MSFFNKLFFPLLLLAGTTHAQNGSFTSISPGDKEADIIYKAAHVTPSPRQLRWQQLELTAFFHFGINTFTNKEWGDGKEDISKFNPTELNAEQWVKTVKDAGIKQVIITAKHHDGFCLWPSRFTEHSIKNTPYKNGKGDIVKEVANACKKYGIGFGVYLSPWDRNSAYYGDSVKYNTYFENQLTELLSNYGKVDEVWFDGANGEGPNGKKQVYDFNSWYKLIRRLQPQAVIAIQGPDVRWVGTETGKGRLTEWSVLPVDEQQQKKIADASQKDVMVKPVVYKAGEDLGSRDRLKGAKGLVWYPAETDVSIRPGWFYHPAEDVKVKTGKELLNIYFSSVGRNSLLLLNIPPDTRGLISDSDVQALKDWTELRESLFKNNLLKGFTVHCPNGINNNALVRSQRSSFWTTKGKDSTAVIEFDSAVPVSFNVLQLQEDITGGQRIEKFSLQYLQNDKWTEITSGTTVGYKRLLNFKPVTAGKVRLVIESSRFNPTLVSVGLFKSDFMP